MSYHITEKETTGFTLLTLSWHIKKKHTVYLELYDISVVFHYKNCLFFVYWLIAYGLYRERFEEEKEKSQSKHCLYLKIFLFVLSKESIIIEQSSVTVYNYPPEAAKTVI